MVEDGVLMLNISFPRSEVTDTPGGIQGFWAEVGLQILVVSEFFFDRPKFHDD